MVDFEMPPVPSVLAILTCDQVIVDAASQKKTLVGVFDAVWAARFPAIQGFGFYARLTDLEGKYKFVIRVIQLDGEKPIGVLESHEISSTDRLGIIEMALNFPPVPFPSPGHYEFQLFANGDFIGRTLLMVKPLSDLQSKG
jgi:hypothetical protein